MKVRAKHEFVHGALHPCVGQEFEINESLAGDLERRGLVEIVKTKMASEPENKMAPAPKNKSKAK